MFWVHLIIFTKGYVKNSKTVLNHAKHRFFCLIIHLKETEPRLCSVACESSSYLEKGGNMEKKYLVWEPILRYLLYLRRSGIIHRGKIRVQNNTLKRYQNVKTSVATSKAQPQYLKHNHKWTIWQIVLPLILHMFI